MARRMRSCCCCAPHSPSCCAGGSQRASNGTAPLYFPSTRAMRLVGSSRADSAGTMKWKRELETGWFCQPAGGQQWRVQEERGGCRRGAGGEHGRVQRSAWGRVCASLVRVGACRGCERSRITAAKRKRMCWGCAGAVLRLRARRRSGPGPPATATAPGAAARLLLRCRQGGTRLLQA
jgi:hypothetical protein